MIGSDLGGLGAQGDFMGKVGFIVALKEWLVLAPLLADPEAGILGSSFREWEVRCGREGSCRKGDFLCSTGAHSR